MDSLEAKVEWAKILNISDWFGWKDFEDVPPNYEEVI